MTRRRQDHWRGSIRMPPFYTLQNVSHHRRLSCATRTCNKYRRWDEGSIGQSCDLMIGGSSPGATVISTSSTARLTHRSLKDATKQSNLGLPMGKSISNFLRYGRVGLLLVLCYQC